MVGVPASPLIRLLLALLAFLFGFPAGGDSSGPDAAPAATCAEAPPSSLTADGRVQLVLEGRPPAGVHITPETMRVACDVMAARLAGLDNPSAVTVLGDTRIAVDVARDEVDRARTAVTRTGLLEIIDPRGQTLLDGTLVTTTLGSPEDVLPPREYEDEEIDDAAYVTIVSGGDVEEAAVGRDALDNPVVSFALTDEAAMRLFDFTSAHIDQPMAILLDKRVIWSPTIQGAVSDQVAISGPFTEEEAADLADSLNLRPLPVPFGVISMDGTPVAGGA